MAFIIDQKTHSIPFLQDPVCSSLKYLQCMGKTNVHSSTCLKPCSGLIITSFMKSEQTKNFQDHLPFIGSYNKYKKITEYPSGFISKQIYKTYSTFVMKALCKISIKIIAIQTMSGRTI